MTRNTTIIAAAALLAAIAIPAHATSRSGPSNQNGPQGGTATAGAQAGAIAGAAAGAIAGGGRASATGGAGGGGGSAQITNTAPATQTIRTEGTSTLRTAPEVAAPAIWSNNPCIIAASGSVSVVGFGASIGAGVEDADCTRRANAQLLAALGQQDAAREVLCANREVREAFVRAGRPCAADATRVASVRSTVTPMGDPLPVPPQPRQAPAPVNTSGLSDSSCATLRARGMAVAGCP